MYYTYQCHSVFQSIRSYNGTRSRNLCFYKWLHWNSWCDRDKSLELIEKASAFNYVISDFLFRSLQLPYVTERMLIVLQR